jgi:hypothetical protein
VFDGERFWLADGFHRVYGHDEAGLAECEALIHYGSKLDAARIALRANAEHGRPRTEKDIDRAYQAVAESRLQPCRWGPKLTTSTAASVSVMTVRTMRAAPSGIVRTSRCADARAASSLGVPAPTRKRMISPRL